MFRCQVCSRCVPRGTPAHRLVLETRPRDYRYRRAANVVIFLDARGKRKKKLIDDPGGTGREIVREAIVCPECAARLNGG